MIIEQELKAVELSPIKKDYYQEWNELLDVAQKLSARWDPTSTNESDPGIVLLKVLTALSDKLNYNIDKNILEAFMPSASQEESMRKLCDMLGYSMKYYQSATTTVVISYTGEEDNVKADIPQFTTLSDIDNEVVYTTVEPGSIYKTSATGTANQLYDEITCIEGSHQICETNDGQRAVYYNLLDDNYRYYMPESMIAENGIFVYDYAEDQKYSSRWTQVANLNTQPGGTKCYKFGFDSRLRVPYLQFPEDVGTLMTDGVEIHYIRTNGIDGNIAARTLEHINGSITSKLSTDDAGTDITSDLSVTNLSAAMNGKNAETLTQAYNSFKKTVGTFDTLVTCRDYMNKIYNLFDDVTNIPLVSNAVAADVRDDINRAFTLCELSDYGIKYTNMKIQDRINNFDLVLYPFKTIYGTNTKTEYEDSFRYTDENRLHIESGLEQNKTLAHNFIYPETGDITCIKNYLKLNAKITTTTKVNSAEEKSILGNIYTAISASFNAREVDFGEDIPFDSILKVVEQADPRIKNVAMDEPELYTAVQYKTVDGTKEVTLTGSYSGSDADSVAEEEKRKLYVNKLILRNILAGRIAAFDYDTSFKHAYNEQTYDNSAEPSIYPIYPHSDDDDARIVKLESECLLPVGTTIPDTETDIYPTITLTDNEVVSFRAPNFITTFTYPAYVNYFLHLTGSTGSISENADYQLQEGEWIAFTYTSSTKDEEGQSSETVINKVYNAGEIIKPNMPLFDSTYNKITNHKNPSKTSGYSFDSQYMAEINKAGTTSGMFTFSPNEQVEIRKKAGVEFNSPSYFYWTLNPFGNDTDGLDLGKRFREQSEDANHTRYILKENEYIYYTDAAQVSMAYYGQGTEIQLLGNNPINPDTDTLILKIPESDTKVSADKIAQMQLRDIPWKYINLDGTNRKIFLQEYQYVNLTCGDSIRGPITTGGGTITIADIGNTWTVIDSNSTTWCQYADNSQVVLPAITVDTVGWEVRSRLEFNMGPATNQTLYNTYDKITMVPEATSVSTVAISPVTITQSGTIVTLPLTLKSNYPIQASADNLDVSVKDAEGKTINDFKISTCKIDGDQMYGHLNNKSNYWTELNYSVVGGTSSTYTLHVNLPTTAEYGLIAVKNSMDQALSLTTSGSLTIFNTAASPSYVTTLTIPKNSFGEVQVAAACDIKLGTTATSGQILFGQLDVVKGINPQLDYQVPTITATPTAAQKEAQLLSDIRNMSDTVRDNFYYNTLLDNSTAIDIDKDGLLTDPKYLYDYNNINNKFVISEIHYDSMKEGITIARSSKL